MMFIFFLNGWWAFALSVLLPGEQPATTPCIRSPLRTGRTSRIFCQFIWMQFSSLVYESRISGELWPSLHSFTRKDFKTVLDFVVILCCSSYCSHTKSAVACLILCVFISRQEGWRLENENPTDPNTPLVFKGVVFNEMKGAFVSQHSLSLSLRLH